MLMFLHLLHSEQCLHRLVCRAILRLCKTELLIYAPALLLIEATAFHHNRLLNA